MTCLCRYATTHASNWGGRTPGSQTPGVPATRHSRSPARSATNASKMRRKCSSSDRLDQLADPIRGHQPRRLTPDVYPLSNQGVMNTETIPGVITKEYPTSCTPQANTEHRTSDCQKQRATEEILTCTTCTTGTSITVSSNWGITVVWKPMGNCLRATTGM